MKNSSPKREQQTERIVAIARRLFAQKGVNETSLEDIAKVCGIRKATLYYYFKSKGEILEHVFNHQWKSSEALMATLKPAMSIEQGLHAMGSNFLVNLDQIENIEFMKIMISEGLKDNKFHMAFSEFMQSRIPEEKMMKLIEPKFKGRGNRDEIKLFFFQFFGALIQYAMHTRLMMVDIPFEIGDEKFLKQLCRIFAKGF